MVVIISKSNPFQTGFSVDEILRKYIRYALNEKPFNPELVANLIQLRKASALEDTQVAEILNEVSRRIERDKGNQIFFVIYTVKFYHIQRGLWTLERLLNGPCHYCHYYYYLK